MDTRIIGTDLVKVYVTDDKGKRKQVTTLFWGDEVKVVKTTAESYIVELPRLVWDDKAKHYAYSKVSGEISRAKTRFTDQPVMKVRFLDVGQGDGAILESPKGKRVLIDGGEEKNLRRYAFVAYAEELRRKPLPIDAIVVSHGDADHFAGLTELLNAYRRADNHGIKEPMVTVDRVFHNGIVKFSGKSGKGLGRTTKIDGVKFLTELYEDPADATSDSLNTPFQAWVEALANRWGNRRKRPKVKRLRYGDDDAFDFLRDEGIDTEVLGPITEQRNGKDVLRWIDDDSHTINGHSIVLRVRYGNVRFMFGADLNEASQESLLARARADNQSLSAEILKVPHHGSADFSPAILEAIRPVVSVVSSGDESAAKEYIHPRAGLVGALGRYSRPTVDKPLVYVTEMVAFFERASGTVVEGAKSAPQNFYIKRSFGIVHVRTDGQRVLVATHSGREDRKEAYAFTVDAQGAITFVNVTMA